MYINKEGGGGGPQRLSQCFKNEQIVKLTRKE